MELARNPFSVLVELSKIIAESGDPTETLQRTAEFIAHRFATDVCSVYTLEPDGHGVRLAATSGLAPESVGRIQLHSGQGLTGMVLERKSHVFISRPWEHPRFEYFRDSGEECLSTFLGVPLVYQQELLGVLVVQTEAEDGLTPDQTEIFQAIASQIAALVAYTGLLRPVSSGPETTREPPTVGKPPHLRKKGASFAAIPYHRASGGAMPAFWRAESVLTPYSSTQSRTLPGRCAASNGILKGPAGTWSVWPRKLQIWLTATGPSSRPRPPSSGIPNSAPG